jgi:hypothetical protein
MFDNSMSAFRYFFEIQPVMPTFATLFTTDVVRIAAQMMVTAPFYAGIAYSLGAIVARHQILVKLFSFEKPEEASSSDSSNGI